MAINRPVARHKPRRRRLRRALGACAVFLLLAIGTGMVASLNLAWVEPGMSKFPVIPREDYHHAPGPITLVNRGLPPTATTTDGSVSPDPRIRVIRVFGSHIDLFEGGQRSKVINFNLARVTLRDVVQLVNDPSWISEPTPGNFELFTALVAEARSHLTIASPHVKHVLLHSIPTVLIGAQQGGTLTFSGVTVESDRQSIPMADIQKTYRPAIVASGAQLDITDSTFKHLGWDWNASYGVSWVNNSTGKAVNSNFLHGFMGVYTSLSSGIQFIGGNYSWNMLYGVDPHTSSSNLLVSGVTAEHNGAHGIIFSDHVTNSVITGCTSRFNGENGIMMDKFSTGNLVQHNTVVGNTGDGLVSSNAQQNTYYSNDIQQNRVGIRIDAGDTSTAATHNTIVANRAVAENIQLDATNKTHDNGGQWRIQVLKRIWAIVALAYAGVVIITFIAVAAHRRHIPPLSPGFQKLPAEPAARATT